MGTSIRFRHQNFDILPNHFGGKIAEDFFSGRTKRFDDPLFINGNDRIPHVIDHPADTCFSFLGHLGKLKSAGTTYIHCGHQTESAGTTDIHDQGDTNGQKTRQSYCIQDKLSREIK